MLWQSAYAFADTTRISKVESSSVCQQVGVSSIPPELEGKYWNRWTSRNFTVLALNDQQAEYLYRHLEHIKRWLCERWGFPDINFSAECMVIAVDDPNIFKKMFRIEKSKTEVRRDENGRIKKSVLFLLTNQPPSAVIPYHLTPVVLAELEQVYRDRFGFWAYRGMSLLNRPVSHIKQDILYFHDNILVSDQEIYYSEALMELIDEKSYRSLSEFDKKLYDIECMFLCLMFRKEFGQDKLHWIMKHQSQQDAEYALKKALGFRNYDHFDNSFYRFLYDLSTEVKKGKTPDSYLLIKKKNKK